MDTDKFLQLTATFSSNHRTYESLSESDKETIIQTLKELNSLDYRFQVVGNHTRAVLLINQLCTIIPIEETQLVIESCLLIEKMLTKQKVQVEGRTLQLGTKWCINSLDCEVNADQDLRDIRILHVLEVLVRCNLNATQSMKYADLIPTIKLIQVMRRKYYNTNHVVLKATVVQCFEAFTYFDIDDIAFLGFLVDLFIYHLSQRSELDEIDCHEAYALRGIHNILNMDNDYSNSILSNVEQLHILLGICKSYMVYKLPNIPFLKPAPLLPSVLPIADSSMGRNLHLSTGGKVQKQRKQRRVKKLMGPKLESIDVGDGMSVPVELSEISDLSDRDNWSVQQFRVYAKIRHETLLLLLFIIKEIEKPILLSYLNIFLSDSSVTRGHILVTCFLHDTSHRCRITALNCLLYILVTSRSVLSHAERRPRDEQMLSFTPVSVVLAGIIVQLHRTLCLALNDQSTTVVAQVLKCLTTLVQATPYHRLPPGLSTKIVRNIKPYLSFKDTIIQVGSLIVLGALLSSQPVIKETTDALLKNIKRISPEDGPKHDDTTEAGGSDIDSVISFDGTDDGDGNSTAEPTTSWLVDLCLRNIMTEGTPAPVKLESLQIMAAIANNFFRELLLPRIGDVIKAIVHALGDEKYFDILYHAGKTTERVGEALHKHQYVEGCLNYSLTFWNSLLESSFLNLLRSEAATLRAVGADCLAAIGEQAFELLPRGHRLLCVTTLLSLASDDISGENASDLSTDRCIKGAAVRALAVLLLYPSIRSDSGFLADASRLIILSMRDKNVTVRIKASWSLGNLSDALVLNSSEMSASGENLLVDVGDGDAVFAGKFEEDQVDVLCLIQTAIDGTNDMEKVKCNAVRALGNLLQLLSDKNVDCNGLQTTNVLTKGGQALLRCASTGGVTKVRWNACYALGNVLKIPLLYQIQLESKELLSSVVFNTLAELIMNYRNLKVRINAAAAIAACTKREYYGNNYVPLWTALLKALENSANVTDYNEYNHRDNLIEQICLTMGHMAAVCTKEDLKPFADALSCHDYGNNNLSKQVIRVHDGLLPEKCAPFFSAFSHLNEFFAQDLSGEQTSALKILSDVFKNSHEFPL